jgi:hypothetical protein
MSVASRPRVKRHRSISVDDRKYFDQYRAFRPNPLARLSILAPGSGRDRKRSDIALQTSDRRSQRQNFEQKVAEVTEIKYSAAGLRSDFSELEFAAIGEKAFRLFASKNAVLSTKVLSWTFSTAWASTGRAEARRRAFPFACQFFISVTSAASCSKFRLRDLLSAVRTVCTRFPLRLLQI